MIHMIIPTSLVLTESASVIHSADSHSLFSVHLVMGTVSFCSLELLLLEFFEVQFKVPGALVTIN